jgi:hypothetical protein
MTQIASPPPPQAPFRADGTPPGVAEKLDALRRRITLWFVLDGLARLLWCAVALIAIDFVLDWTFSMDRAQRGVMLALGLFALAAVAYYHLIRPLSVSFSDDALCQQIEARHGELGQSLISAVQFSRLANIDEGRVSPAMIRATIEQGTQRARGIHFPDVLSVSGFYRSLVLIVVAVAGLGLFVASAASQELVRIWVDRNVMLGEELWPQAYYFEIAGVKNGVLTIPRGDDWPLQVAVVAGQEKLPPADELNVQLDLRTPRERRFETMERDNEDYHYRLPLKSVLEEFRFQCTTRRSASNWIEVKLIDRPEVKELTLTVTPPAYTGRKATVLPTGSGPYFVLKGSLLRVTGRANQPLAGATLALDELLLPMQLTGEESFALELPAERVAAGTYRINLLSKQQVVLPGDTAPSPLASKRPTPFTLRQAIDGEPQVKVKLTGIGGMVVPGAKLPCSVRINDDFAVRDVRLAYEWRTDVSAGEQIGEEIPLGQEVVGAEGRQRVAFDYDFQLAPLKIATGSALKFVFQANDNDDVSGPKTGRSTALLLRVVTEDELRADLLRREKEQRVEFEHLLTQQDDLYTESDAMLAATRDQAELSTDRRGLLVKLQKRQKLLGAAIGSVAERLSDVLLELQNNNLEEPNGPLQKRLMELIIEPIERLASEAVPQAATQLDETRRLFDKLAERDTALASAVEKQKAIAEKMREILHHMVKSEGYQEAINLFYEVERQQQELLKMTLEERQQRLQDLLKKQNGSEGNSTNKPKEQTEPANENEQPAAESDLPKENAAPAE